MTTDKQNDPITQYLEAIANCIKKIERTGEISQPVPELDPIKSLIAKDAIDKLEDLSEALGNFCLRLVTFQKGKTSQQLLKLQRQLIDVQHLVKQLILVDQIKKATQAITDKGNQLMARITMQIDSHSHQEIFLFNLASAYLKLCLSVEHKTELFLTKEINQDQYQASIISELDDIQSIVDERTEINFTLALINLALCIALLGIGFLIAGLIHQADTGHFLFFTKKKTTAISIEHNQLIKNLADAVLNLVQNHFVNSDPTLATSTPKTQCLAD